MKTYLKIIALLCFICLMLTASAQCPEGDIVIETQEQIDNFSSNYPNCIEIDGNLSIEGSVVNLDSLNQITSISGNLYITNNNNLVSISGLENLSFIGGNVHFWYNSNLTSLSGLENLNSIEGSFDIRDNSFTDLSGLENLSSIGNGIRIRTNNNLTSLSGLENLSAIGGSVFITLSPNLTDLSALQNINSIESTLWIESCPGLTNLSGLENINSMGQLHIKTNDNLTSLSGLENLNSVEGDVVISANDNLIDLSGLENLNSIGGDLNIGGNNSLINLSGLENLNSVEGYLYIRVNDNLTDLWGLGGLNSIGEYLDIKGNSSLSQCNIESICEYFEQGNVGTIADNAEGCNTAFQVTQGCGFECPPIDVVLLSQQDVNQFGAFYPDCTELEGNLQIGTDFGGVADITDLSPLNNITSIAGDFTSIETISLVGLENLTTIGGRLDVNVESFQGLNGLTTIGGWLFVSENNPVQNFIGLESLTSIGDRLRLDENCCISSFTGLGNLSYIGDNLWIDSECNCINSFSGLESLTTIEGNLQIAGVTATDFTGLDNLSTIGGSIHLNQSGMNSLSGLENVTVFGNNPTPWPFTEPGQIVLENNSSLTDISAISDIPISNLSLQNNENLSVCNMENICEYFAQGGIGITENNAEGCNSVNEIVESCGFDCPPTVVLLSQADVDEFGMLYPDCTEIEGSLQIGTGRLSAIPPTNINDLSPLNGITFIGVDLIIGKNDTLMTLAGLSNLDTVGNNLILHDRSTLTSFEGLENLTLIGGNLDFGAFTLTPDFTGLNNLNSIEGDFRIEAGLSDLSGFAGLGNLTTIGGTFDIAELNFLNFQGLNNLSSIGGGFSIDEDNNFENFIGLESLTTIGGNLYIDEDNSIVSFSGLENLNYIGGDFFMDSPWGFTGFFGLESLTTIEGSMGLNFDGATDFTGLNSLSAVGGGISIGASADLTSLTGLENITSFGYSTDLIDEFGTTPGAIKLSWNNSLTDISAISHLTIDTLTLTNNSSLAVCNVESICEYLAQGGAATIENNAEGCNTVEEIIQVCTLEYVIEGNVFEDANTDCLQDTSETGLDNWLIKIEQDNQTPRYTYTFGGGNYIALADSGAQYTLTAIPPNMLWDNICPISDVVSISTDNPHDGVDFGATGSARCPLLEVDITSPIVRRCFDSNYYVRYCNSGTAIAENAYVEVQLDPYFTFQNATIDEIDLGENLYSFDLGNIDIGECGSFRIDVYVDCDSTILGQTHCVEAHIYPDSICTPALPLWDGASIKVGAQCLGDSIEFKIENIGGGDMSDSLEYIIVEEDLIFQRANFQLDSGQNETFYKTANGLFHRLEAEQSPGHPGNSMPSVFVQGCGENDNGEISIGFVNYYLLDEGDAFVSIDCQENVGSYDPNDKQAFPVGYGVPHYITDSTDLEYLIRFQNTGTDTAFNIVIRDMVSPHLNIETLRPGVASHPYRYDIEDSNTAVFHFENIMLPDSNVNEAASHGFIKFNIKQKQNNPIGTHIMNEADIYFDFNDPIITNTVYHTVGADFRGIVTAVITPPELAEAGVWVNVFPNPFNEYARFEVQGETVKELHLSVYDMTGREVFQQNAKHQQHITMKRNNLPPGVYVFRLMDEKQQLATGKLVIK